MKSRLPEAVRPAKEYSSSPSRHGVTQGGSNITFGGNELIGDGRTVIKAKVTATDDYGNSAIGEGQRTYEVDIDPPKPSLTYNTITTNDVINQATSEEVTISGDIINLQAGETGMWTRLWILTQTTFWSWIVRFLLA